METKIDDKRLIGIDKTVKSVAYLPTTYLLQTVWDCEKSSICFNEMEIDTCLSVLIHTFHAYVQVLTIDPKSKNKLHDSQDLR